MRDPQGIDFKTACSWNDRTLSFAFDTGTADIAGNAERDAVRRAFASWQALGRLTFTEVPLSASPDIVIDWRPAEYPDGHSMVGGILAHSDFPPGCSVVTSTLPKPVHFDDSEHVWSVGAAVGAFDVETVALHEIGHIVGLEHSTVAGAVMLPTIDYNTAKRTLTKDDIDGFRALYPPRVWWQLSDSGTGSWRRINTSSYRLPDLAFGDFTGDGRTDVFRASGTAWFISEGGTGSWRQINTSSLRLPDLAFGDFTGDGNTDVFRASGTAWFISRGRYRQLAADQHLLVAAARSRVRGLHRRRQDRCLPCERDGMVHL